MKTTTPPLRIGLLGIGLDAYWPQFEGLKERLEGYVAQAAKRFARPGVEICNAGLVDSPERAVEAGSFFRRSEVDIIFLHVTTYALSSTVLPVAQRAKVPVVIMNLQPGEAIDYGTFNKLGDRTKMTGEWLAWCSACPVPEIANAFKRARIDFHQVTGTLLENDPVWREIDDWIEAARVAHAMANNRLGLLGHYYNGMLDIYTDLTAQLACFGGHMEILEVEELASLRRGVTKSSVDAKLAEFRGVFDIQPDVPEAELVRAANTAVALDHLVEKHRLGSMAYYYMGTGSEENEDVMTSVILGNSLLTGRGIPVAGEYEVKNAQAMKIMDTFGVGGSFTEYYAADFREDVILLGHDGPGHIKIASGKTKVRPLDVYHGKVGRGLSVEMSVRHGPVTLLSVVDGENGRPKFLVAEGESVPGPILEIGNTNSRYKFPVGARGFMEKWNVHGPAHHCAIGVGHISDKLGKLAALLGISMEKVC
ncbi:MAG: arabinose isomerase [Chthoniobacterales bacterium]|nr:arabinose isomerase [Chthoniobacterales bacterium]